MRIGPTDWYALLSDSDILARSAAVPLPDALSLAALAATQRDPRVLSAAVGIAEGVPRALTTGTDGVRFAEWVRARFGPRARALGWQPHPDEDADTRRLRRVVVPFVADRGGDAALAREARQRAARWPQDPRAVSPDIRGVLLVTAARTAGRDGPALYAHMLATAAGEKDARLRRDLIKALGWFRDPATAVAARELMLSGPFAPVEALSILGSQLENDATRVGALAWLDTHYDALAARGAQDDFEALPYWAGDACSSSERADFVKALAQRMQSVDGGPRSYAKALEQIDLCLAYRAVQQPALAAWLAAGAGRPRVASVH
jgi:alanyl aminopeptidase